MARFILDVANFKLNEGEEWCKNLMKDLTENYASKIISIHCIDKSNDNQFHEENYLNTLSEMQIKNFNKLLKDKS